MAVWRSPSSPSRCPRLLATTARRASPESVNPFDASASVYDDARMPLPSLPDVAGLDFVCRRYREPVDLADIEQVRGAIRAVEPRAWLPGPDTHGEAGLEDFCVIVSVNGT